MSQPHNPYVKPTNVSMAAEEDVSMQELSPSSKDSSSEENKVNKEEEAEEEEHAQENQHAEEEEILFKQSPFQIPPSFNQLINKETL